MDKENSNEETDLSGIFKDFGGVKIIEYETPRSYSPDSPKIIQWAMKYSGGLLKDEKQASYLLFGFAMAIVVFLIGIFGGGADIPRKALENPEYGLPEAD